jgi:predicted RNA-binding Zn ribbon-like protein
LDSVIDDQMWAPRELAQCLTAIAQAAPALLQDSRYQRLALYSRRRST